MSCKVRISHWYWIGHLPDYCIDGRTEKAFLKAKKEMIFPGYNHLYHMWSLNVCADKNPTQINMLSFLSVVEFLNENWAVILDAQVFNCQMTGCACTCTEGSWAHVNGQMCNSAAALGSFRGAASGRLPLLQRVFSKSSFWSDGSTCCLSHRS